MQSPCLLAVVLLFAVAADAQTETVVNNAGLTVVEVVTQNAAGIPTTRVLQTIVGSSTSQTLVDPLTALTSSTLLQTSSLSLATTTQQQVGPVGQPASVPPAGGPTPYTYTTTDANGNAVVKQGIFTPTGPQTVLPAPTMTGTVLGYSQWLSMIGTYTVAASAARVSMSVATGWYYFAATALAGLAGGAWLIFP